ARALRRSDPHAQTDLFLEEGSVGAVRSRQRSQRAAQPLRAARPGGAHRHAEGRARAPEEGSPRRRPARERAAAQRRRRYGGEAPREVKAGYPAVFLKLMPRASGPSETTATTPRKTATIRPPIACL